VVLWEGVVSSQFAGTRVLSVRQFVLTLADRLSHTHPSVFDALLPPTTALVMAAVVTLAATTVAIRRLERFEVGEAA
jgi:ABC-2 type transport system permease protein